MDSLFVKSLINLQNRQDTILVHVNNLTSAIHQFEYSSLSTKYLPFIGVIIGGLITYFGQYLLKKKDLHNSTLKDIIICKNKIRESIVMLRYHLSELAYLQVDSRFQYYLSIVEENNADRERAANEHYNDYKYISYNKEKMASALSEINSAITGYYNSKKIILPDSVRVVIETDTFFNLPLPRQYSEKDKVDETILLNDINELRRQYLIPIQPLINIANQL